MKKWNNPEINELNLSNTEGMALEGDWQDGVWYSRKNPDVGIPTYSEV